MVVNPRPPCLQPTHCDLDRKSSSCYAGLHLNALPERSPDAPTSAPSITFRPSPNGPLLRPAPPWPWRAHLCLQAGQCVQSSPAGDSCLLVLLFSGPSPLLLLLSTGIRFKFRPRQHLRVFLTHCTTVIPPFRHASKFIQYI